MVSVNPDVTPRSGLAWLWLSLAVILLDQWSKWLLVAHFQLYEVRHLTPGFNLVHVHNYGAAFSFLSQAGGWQRWFFALLATAISLYLLAWLRRLRADDLRQSLPIALVLGGAVGNLIDRIRLGYVVDFVDIYYDQWHWPAFNVADAAISVGAVALVLFGLRSDASAARQP